MTTDDFGWNDPIVDDGAPASPLSTIRAADVLAAPWWPALAASVRPAAGLAPRSAIWQVSVSALPGVGRAVVDPASFTAGPADVGQAWSQPGPLPPSAAGDTIGSSGDGTGQPFPDRDPGAGFAVAAGTKNELAPVPGGDGPHTSFRRDPTTGIIQHYETYEYNDRAGRYAPLLRYRGDGKPHYPLNPPFILEQKPGKGLGRAPEVPRPALPGEIPRGSGGGGGGGGGMPPTFQLLHRPGLSPEDVTE